MSLAPTLTERDRESESVRREARYEDLYGELLSAFLQCDPGRRVLTPGYGDGTTPAFDVLVDSMAGVNSDDMRSRVSYVLGLAATQKADEALQQMALRILRDAAHEHAQFCAGAAL